MHKIVGDRALGDSAEAVGDLAQVALAGLAEGGVAGVIKHMPGHGRAEVDSHETLPVVRASRELVERDIAPFKLIRHAAMGMTAHLAYAALDDETTPATHSRKIIHEVIRKEIGFDGLLMTDDLGMKARLGSGEPGDAGAGGRVRCDPALLGAGCLGQGVAGPGDRCWCNLRKWRMSVRNCQANSCAGRRLRTRQLRM